MVETKTNSSKTNKKSLGTLSLGIRVSYSELKTNHLVRVNRVNSLIHSNKGFFVNSQ